MIVQGVFYWLQFYLLGLTGLLQCGVWLPLIRWRRVLHWHAVLGSAPQIVSAEEDLLVEIHNGGVPLPYLIVKIQIERIGRALIEVLKRIKVAPELTAGLRSLGSLGLIICVFIEEHPTLKWGLVTNCKSLSRIGGPLLHNRLECEALPGGDLVAKV